MQQSPADLSSSMSMQAQSSITASASSSLESSSFDNMDMMMAGMDSSTDTEQMIKMAIALMILEMINGGGGASGGGGQSGTDLLGMLNAESLLQSAGQGSTQTDTQSAQASVTIEQSASVSYAQNAYASSTESSAPTQDPNQQLSNVDVMI